MILLENKMVLFNKLVFKEREKECQEKIQNEILKSQELLKEKEIEFQKKSQDLIDRRVSLAKEKKYEMIAQANESQRILRLEKNENLLARFIDDLFKAGEEFTKTDSYFDLQKNLFEKVIAGLKKGTYYLEIMAYDSAKDQLMAIAKKNNMQIILIDMDKSQIGGFKISDIEKTYKIDCSLKTKIEDSKYEIGKMFYFELEEVENWI